MTTDYTMLTMAFMLVVLASVWYNHRIGWRKGYATGVVDAIDTMIEEGKFSAVVVADNPEEKDRPASKDEMRMYFVRKITEQRFS